MPEADPRWKTPVIPFVHNVVPVRPGPESIAALTQASVPQISDLVGRMYTCQPQMHSLVSPAIPLCGSAFTVKCPPGDNLGVPAALREVQAGDVLVIDGQGFTHWCMGGFEMLKYACGERGMAGVVVNGGWRDIAEAQQAGFPVYGLAVSTYSGPKIGPAELNVPVACAGVIVHPGDVICASIEGVVVVPRAHIMTVVKALPQSESGHGMEHLQAMDDIVADWLNKN